MEYLGIALSAVLLHCSRLVLDLPSGIDASMFPKNLLFGVSSRQAIQLFDSLAVAELL